MTLLDFLHVELPPPLTQHVHIQTHGDHNKRVVTPFGTTRLKKVVQHTILPFAFFRQEVVAASSEWGPTQHR